MQNYQYFIIIKDRPAIRSDALVAYAISAGITKEQINVISLKCHVNQLSDPVVTQILNTTIKALPSNNGHTINSKTVCNIKNSNKNLIDSATGGDEFIYGRHPTAFPLENVEADFTHIHALILATRR